MQNLKRQQIFRIKILLTFLVLLTACGTTNPLRQSQEELDKKIEIFNSEFQSKALDRCSRFVHPDHREKFQIKSLDFIKKVTILNATTLDLKILKDDKPVIATSSIFEEDFDKAELMIRYQLSILPSIKLKTIIVKQEWVKLNNTWYVLPNLDSFINKT